MLKLVFSFVFTEPKILLHIVMTDKEKLKQEQVEKYGVLLEKFGFQRMVGRTIGFLILAEPPHKTFDEIREYLQASKSSVSTALQVLIMKNLVTYFTLPGDRKRYFKFIAESWTDMLKNDLGRAAALRDILYESVALREKDHEAFNEGLTKIADFQDFISKIVPELISKWIEENNKE
jgi:DNA-binding transcriptional regulator GbsR (MarR family)